MDMDPYISETLCTMLRAGRREVAIALISEADCDLNHRSNRGQTPLHIAPEAMLHGVTALLLVKGADPDAQDEMGRTPLMNAARTGDVKSVQHLLKHHANPNLATTKARWTALMWAAKRGQVEIIKALLNADADPAAVDAKGLNALAIARRFKRAAVEPLLSDVT
jgi:ankyrin repeat protein